MQIQLKQDFDKVLVPLGRQSVEFFLAASLYHARKISFAAAASLAGMSFEGFLARLQEHFGTGFMIADETVEEDLATVEKILTTKS
ncbi:MAG: hypothetical protein GY862_03880 [Gammaproteobacteria bacterium]|nr:hypothetical protein [Gammaproteobacteria bacterium]